MIKHSDLAPAIIGITIAILISYIAHQWTVVAPIEFFQREASHVVVKAGDRVTVSWKDVRNDWCDSLTHRRLITSDKKIIEFEVTHDNAKPVYEDNHGQFSFVVPTGLAEGPLIYRVHTQFRCNVVQRFLGGSDFVFPDIVFQYKQNG